MPKISPFLWFDRQAHEAAKYYVSLFKNSKILKVTHCTGVGPGKKGSIQTVRFKLAGQEFIALNGGPHFKFTEAVSFVVNCRTQAEIDYYWKRLTRGGEEGPCGWLKDKYGLSWQVVPASLPDLLGDSDNAANGRVISVILKSKKLDIAQLKKAYAGKN